VTVALGRERCQCAHVDVKTQLGLKAVERSLPGKGVARSLERAIPEAFQPTTANIGPGQVRRHPSGSEPGVGDDTVGGPIEEDRLQYL